MEYDQFIRQQNHIVKEAVGLATAAEALSIRLRRHDCDVVLAPTTYSLLGSLKDVILSLVEIANILRSSLTASLSCTAIRVIDTDPLTGDCQDPSSSVKTANEMVSSAAVTLDFAERCLSSAQNALAGQGYGRANPHTEATTRE